MDALRPAASIEGLLVFAVLWLILGALGKAKKGSSARPSPPKPPGPRPDPGQERFSLQQVLKEIERVKREQQAQATSGRATTPLTPRPRVGPRTPVPVRAARPRPSVTEVERGPLGRTTAVRLPSAQEAPPVDLDAEAEEVAQQRIQEAEARNRALSDADYRRFHQRVLAEDRAAAVAKPRPSPSRFRGAIVWREILGPPRALEEWDQW